MIGILGFAILIFLPGQWITFGLPVSNISFWARFLVGAVLGPLVIVLQFYMLRSVGASFELTSLLLVALNIPVLGLILKRWNGTCLPSRYTLAASALVLLIPLAFFGPSILNAWARVYTGHTWMHADIVYQIANGNLILEDPELAGVRLAYPWAGHVYQGVLSYLLDASPASSYIWTNLVYLLLIYGLLAGIVAELGGKRYSQITSIIWLFFGVNFVGYILEKLIWTTWGKWYPITGDYRYTPWLLKFFFFEQEPLALGAFVALVFVTLRQWRVGFTKYPLVLIGLLLYSMAIIYPILFPAAAAVVASTITAILFQRVTTGRPLWREEISGLASVLLSAMILTFIYVKFLTPDTVAAALHISGLKTMLTNSLTTAVVTSPLLIGLGFAFRKLWQLRRGEVLILVLGALASALFYAALQLRGLLGTEYKYILTAAICLAPFPSMALEPFMERLGRRALPATALITLILAVPFAYKLYSDWPWLPDANLLTMAPPPVDASGFDLRLDGENKLAGLCDAIRLTTPVNTVLVLREAELHLPTLTRRSLYAPPAQDKRFPGINVDTDDLLVNSKGYDVRLLEERRSILAGLYVSDDPIQRERALGQILALNRPIAIVIEKQYNASLLDWLSREKGGQVLYDGNGFILWLIQAGRV